MAYGTTRRRRRTTRNRYSPRRRRTTARRRRTSSAQRIVIQVIGGPAGMGVPISATAGKKGKRVNRARY